MKQVYPHQLSDEAAHDAVNRALAAYREKFADYNPHIEWSSPGHAQFEIEIDKDTMSGSILVHSDEIVLQMNMPSQYESLAGPDTSFFEQALRDELHGTGRGRT